MNIIEYVKNSTEKFSERPLGPVDSLVLSQLSYARLENVLQGDKRNLARPGFEVRDFFRNECFDEVFNDGISDEENLKLLAWASGSRRFRGLKVRNIEAETDESAKMQFAAMTFELDDGSSYAAFRGTDGALLAWREDFNLSFMNEVPSQGLAVQYINRHFGGRNRRRLYLGGHSKGGNLAVYAAAHCSPAIRSRIAGVYSHDGPGFRDEVAGEIDTVLQRDQVPVVKEVPQTSIVGMLLESPEEHRVVKSDAAGIMQHMAFSWQIEGNDFVYQDDLSAGGAYFDRTLRDWLMSVSDEKREIFVNTLFDIFEENGIHTLNDLKDLNLRDVGSIVGSLRHLDDESSRVVMTVLKSLVNAAVRQISQPIHL